MIVPTIKAYNAIFYRKEGCLYYSYPEIFNGPIQKAKITKWEENLQVKVLDKQGWRFSTPQDLVLIAPDKKNLAGKEIIEFMTSIPEEILDLAAPYQHFQIPVLRLLKHNGAQDLARQSPIIFWLLAEQSCHHLPSGDIKLNKLLNAKKRNILEQLGFIASKSAIKLLGKVKVPFYDNVMFDAFKKILSTASILESLRHYHDITENELFAALDCPTLLTKNFFKNHIAVTKKTKSEISSAWNTYRDTVRLARVLRRRGFSRAIRSFKSLEQLRKMHDRFIEEMNQRNVKGTLLELETRFGKKLPKPIFPGADNIIPITSFQELVLESCEMQHCVASYAEKIVQGKSSIYKIMIPERATVEVESRSSQTKIAQVKLYRNGKPNQKTLEAVEKWFFENLEKCKRKELRRKAV